MGVMVKKLSKARFMDETGAHTLDTITTMVLETHNEAVKSVRTFPVLYQGWECDSVAFVVQTYAGNRYLMGTNHGRAHFLSRKEARAWIALYRTAIRLTTQALDLTRKK